MDYFVVKQFANSSAAPTGPVTISHGYSFDKAVEFVRDMAPRMSATHLIVQKCPRV